jgi:regulator of sigma E protease
MLDCDWSSDVCSSDLKPGDVINRIDATPIASWQGFAEYVHGRPEQQMTLFLRRGDAELSIVVTPKKDPSRGIGLIGVSPQMLTERVSALRAVDYGSRMVVFQSVFTLRYLGEKIIKWEKSDVAGPIGVIQILAKAAKAGWENLLYLLAVISTALGLFNLLPIPILDGGHIFLSLIEGVLRRPLNRRMIAAANLVGLALIGAIFIFATYNDLARTGLFGKTLTP